MPAFLIFGTIFLAELPDKTSIMTLAFLGRYPLVVVWVGAALALIAQTIIGLTAGRLLALVPRTPLTILEVLLLLGFSVWLWRESNEPAAKVRVETAPGGTRTTVRSILSVFLVIFAAEFLDLTQMATMTYAATYPAHILEVGAVAAGALLAANAVVVLAGTALWTRISGPWLQRVSAVLFLLVAVFLAVSQWGLGSVSL